MTARGVVRTGRWMALALIAPFTGCASRDAQGGGQPQHPAAEAKQRASVDGSRCDHEQRPDRDVTESISNGSLQHNVRRVYAVSGEGEQRRRIIVCREVDTNLDGRKDVFRTYNPQGQPLEERADSNYDGVIDTWIRFDKGQIIQVEIDEAWDGQPDERRHYIRGKLARIERDTDQDGATDVWEYYAGGRLDRIGIDTNHDGRVDRWNRETGARDEREHDTSQLSDATDATAP